MTRQSRRPFVAIDIGNSQITAGLFLQDVADEGRLPQPERTLSLCTQQWDPMELALWLAPNRPANVAWFIVSVHKKATAELQHWLEQEEGIAAPVLLAHTDLPLKIEMPDPGVVGMDRLVGAVAANRIRPVNRPAIVIDLGSAITVDVISASGSFRGGAILPGIQMSARALHEFTDRLPEVTVGQQPPQSALGQSTAKAISSGIYWGVVGAIRALLGELRAELADEPMVLVTGGNAALVVETLECTAHDEPHLILAGIALVAESIRCSGRGT